MSDSSALQISPDRQASSGQVKLPTCAQQLKWNQNLSPPRRGSVVVSSIHCSGT